MLIGYAIRFLACMLTMEFILHFMYVVAIKDTKSWLGDSPLDLSMIGFWNLMVVWLKVCLDDSTYMIFNCLHAWKCQAPSTVAIFPNVGAAGRHRSARKHGPLHGEQLLATRVLARMASQL